MTSEVVVGGDFVFSQGTRTNRIARLNQTGASLWAAPGSGYGLSGAVNAVAIQSDGKIVVGGSFTAATGVVQNYIARLNTDGTLDTGFNTGGTIGVSNTVQAIAIQPDGKIVIGGFFNNARGTTQSSIARLNTDGTLDTGFNTGGTVGTNGVVYAIAIQSDDKIVIGGTFATVRGTTQNRIARLNTDGTLDTGFNTGGTIGVSSTVFAMAIQSDGKIVIGGTFTTARGTTQNRIARLNTDGTLDTGFNTGGTVGVDGEVNAIAIQSDGKIVIGGLFTAARGTTRNYIARLNTDGTLDTGFNTGGTVGTNATVRAIAIQSDGKIVIGGQFTTARGTTQNYIARLNTNGTLDTGFNTGGTVGVDFDVNAAAVQSDGKIVIGGRFGMARGVSARKIARLGTDGTLDTGFSVSDYAGVDDTVNAVAVQSDGKIVIGGLFTTALGVSQNRIARLNTDGTLDTGFNTGGTIGVNERVNAVAVQSDGKIVVGGGFTTARGTTQNRIARLNTDGTLDTGFNTGGTIGTNGTLAVIAIQPDGQIVIGGGFTTVRGTTQNRIARLNTDGTLDTGFNTGGTVGMSGVPEAIAFQPDGKIVVGGSFTTARGTTQNNIARLNTDGTLDTGFNTGGTVGVNGAVSALAIQSDGKIVIGGSFTTARGTTRNYIARLNTDGTLDTGFNTGGTVGVDNVVRAIAIQPDGKIVIGGQFTTARGTTRNGLARLNTDGTLDTGFNSDATSTTSQFVYAIGLTVAVVTLLGYWGTQTQIV